MRHYKHLKENELDKIFEIKPQNFNKYTDKELLSLSLGATMYMQSTREDIADNIINKKYISLTSMVIDFEDALDDDKVQLGEDMFKKHMIKLKKAIENKIIKENDIPLIFIRVRNIEQFKSLLKLKDYFDFICAFIFPKFSTQNAQTYIRLLDRFNSKNDTNIYYMPVLETKEIMYLENRKTELLRLKGIIDGYSDLVLNIRLGGTDFCSLYGIRRSIDTTIYDVRVMMDCISDILNIFNRSENSYVVSGVVWEYFPKKNAKHHNRLFKPSLRETPFADKGKSGQEERKNILDNAIDGLLKEVALDKINGICGKTIIHPTHIKYVNSLQVVTFEEYEDALNVINNKGKGVIKSEKGNKMNEIKPHYNWAVKILNRAKIYGVLKDDVHYTSLW